MVSYKHKYTGEPSSWINSPKIAPIDCVGFVYQVTNKRTGKAYIGITRFWEKKKLKPLKGNKRKRVVMYETEWRTYNTSGLWKDDIENHPNLYHKQIIRNCKSKSELKGYEAYLVLQDYFENKGIDYVNKVVQLRIKLSK